MGSMSASDAAPLPRLGEVYFDVRGESRSMRLSWYADTGVAVFSIWQGGTCTGTFRLPIADLPRMIQALQRGPHGDAPSPAEQPDSPRGATEPHGRPGPPGRTGEQVTSGYETGYNSGPLGPGDHGTGDYGSGDYGPGPGEYRRTGAHGRYEETRAIHPDDSLPGGERGGRYEDEPTGVYRGDLLNEDYRDEPGVGYRDAGRGHDRRGGELQDDPLAGGYRDEPAASGYRDEPAASGYRDDPHGSGQADDRRTRSYREDPLAGGYRSGDPGDELTSRYRDPLDSGHRDIPRRGRADPDDELTSRYGDDPLDSGHRHAQHGGAYPDSPPAGHYPGDPLTGAYPEDRGTGGYPEDQDGGYTREPMTARYPADPLTGDYPTGPSADSAIDSDDYPPSSGNAGYSPARPYVAPLPGSAGGTAGGRRRGRGRPASREESDPSPDSFPYGRPPAEPEVRGRGR
jgi:hypothetical protein